MQVSLDSTLAALADPSRRRVVEILKHGPQRAGEIATGSGMSPPAMSRHLRVLLSSGLIEAERIEDDARLRIFKLKRGPFDELGEWLAEVESFWAGQLGSFRDHSERVRAAGVKDEAPGGARRKQPVPPKRRHRGRRS